MHHNVMKVCDTTKQLYHFYYFFTTTFGFHLLVTGLVLHSCFQVRLVPEGKSFSNFWSTTFYMPDALDVGHT